jgi:hypothetical protein
MSAVLDTALRACRAGISVIPISEDGSKSPRLSSWKRFQQERADEVRIQQMCTGTGLAFIGGAVSAGLECLDFDSGEAFDAFVELCRASDLGELLERVANGYHERTPHGAHLWYRCPAAQTTKLARSAEGKCKIETRGEGGYAIVAPSHGRVHETGESYELVAGGVESIVSISTEERELLHGVARALDERAEPDAVMVEPELAPDPECGERPGDEWARVTSWVELLEPRGWKRLFIRHDVTYWRRPGKPRGISATTNYAGSDLLYVFSTSTEFEANRGYGKFGAYALLEHASDFRAAGRRLRDEGYGTTRRTKLELVDLSAFAGAKQAPEIKPLAKTKSTFPEHLFEVPGLVGELHRYMVDAAPKPQPIIALGAALAAIGTLVGRRVQSETGVRTNVYIAALVDSGAGKEWPRTAIRRAFRTVNLEPMVGIDEVTSDAAINGILLDHPSCLLMFDELGDQLGDLHDKPSGVLRTLLKLWGLAKDAYYGKTYALDRKSNKRGNDYIVHQPNVSVLGTSVPRRFWASLTDDDVDNGLLARFMLFESEDPDPQYRPVRVDAQAPPSQLVEALERWRPSMANSLAYLSAIGAHAPPPEPLVVPATESAARVFEELEDFARSRRNQLRETGRGAAAALFNRVREQAVQLALIRAAGCGDPSSAEIEQVDAEWGAELALWCMELMLQRVEQHVGESDYGRKVKLATAFIEAAGALKLSEFTYKFKNWTARERDDVLETLDQSGLIERCRQPATGGKGRPAVVLRWRS